MMNNELQLMLFGEMLFVSSRCVNEKLCFPSEAADHLRNNEAHKAAAAP